MLTIWKSFGLKMGVHQAALVSGLISKRSFSLESVQYFAAHHRKPRSISTIADSSMQEDGAEDMQQRKLGGMTAFDYDINWLDRHRDENPAEYSSKSIYDGQVPDEKAEELERLYESYFKPTGSKTNYSTAWLESLENDETDSENQAQSTEDAQDGYEQLMYNMQPALEGQKPMRELPQNIEYSERPNTAKSLINQGMGYIPYIMQMDRLRNEQN